MRRYQRASARSQDPASTPAIPCSTGGVYPGTWTVVPGVSQVLETQAPTQVRARSSAQHPRPQRQASSPAVDLGARWLAGVALAGVARSGVALAGVARSGVALAGVALAG